MWKEKNLHPRKYLKNAGFVFDAKPAQLSKRFLKSLNEEDREKADGVFQMAAIGLDISTQLYPVPKTLKQACLLYSHDADRYPMSMTWIASLIQQEKPSSVFEVGCGAGLMVDYIGKRFPSVSATGIDRAENLIEIGRKELGRELLAGDYPPQPNLI